MYVSACAADGGAARPAAVGSTYDLLGVGVYHIYISTYHVHLGTVVGSRYYARDKTL